MKLHSKLTGFLTAVILICTHVHCKKDKDKDDNKSKTELLTSGAWHVTAHTSNPAVDWNNDGVAETDLYSVYEACEKDNTVTFSTNGTFESNEGALKCDAADPQTDTGTWAFTDNETKIISDGTTLNLEELTSTRMRFSTNLFGITSTITLSH